MSLFIGNNPPFSKITHFPLKTEAEVSFSQSPGGVYNEKKSN